MVFLKKALLGLGALILIFIGGSGTQSNSLLLQGGGFIGLIIGLVVLYIFGKMAWRAMGCLPSFLVVISIIAFILYAIGGFNNGIGGVGQSLRSFLGMQANSQQQMPQNGQIMIVEEEYAPAIDENFSSDIGSQAEVQPQAEQRPNAFQQLISSFGGQREQPAPAFNPNNFPAIYGAARVINGDTLEIRGSYFKLYGIDAPEANQTCADRQGRSYNCGREAALWLKTGLPPMNLNVMSCSGMPRETWSVPVLSASMTLARPWSMPAGRLLIRNIRTFMFLTNVRRR